MRRAERKRRNHSLPALIVQTKTLVILVRQKIKAEDLPCSRSKLHSCTIHRDNCQRTLIPGRNKGADVIDFRISSRIKSLLVDPDGTRYRAYHPILADSGPRTNNFPL